MSALRKAREQKGWRQTDLAKYSGVSVRTIVNLEQGHTHAQNSVAHAICMALGVPWQDKRTRRRLFPPREAA